MQWYLIVGILLLLLLLFWGGGRTAQHGGILVSRQGMEPVSPELEAGSLNRGAPGKFLHCHFDLHYSYSEWC